MENESEILFPEEEGYSRGIAICLTIGIMAYFLDALLEANDLFSLGTGTLAFILGGIAAQLVSGIRNGGDWVIKNILPITIICLGFGLDLSLLFSDEGGRVGLVIGISSAIFCLISSVFIGRMFGITTESALAIGCGGAICGNSAVVAVSSPLKISKEVLAMILATVNILGIITFISIPVLAAIIGMEESSAGIWAGSTIHAVPQAISAGDAIGGEGIVMATTIKLSRVALLAIVVPICAIVGRSPDKGGYFTNPLSRVPYFLPGFILAAILATWLMPEDYSGRFDSFAKFSLAPVMASIGFFITKGGVGSDGSRIFAVGAISSIAMVLFSFMAIYFFV